MTQDPVSQAGSRPDDASPGDAMGAGGGGGFARAVALLDRLTGALALLDRLIGALALIVAVAAVSALFLALMADVVVRYATTRGLGWPSELPQLLFPWLAMGGAVAAAQQSRHILIPALVEALPIRYARLIVVAMMAIAAGVFLWLADAGLSVLEITGSEVYPMTGVTAVWAYAALVSGFVALAVVSLTAIPPALRAVDAVDLLHDDVEHRA